MRVVAILEEARTGGAETLDQVFVERWSDPVEIADEREERDGWTGGPAVELCEFGEIVTSNAGHGDDLHFRLDSCLMWVRRRKAFRTSGSAFSMNISITWLMLLRSRSASALRASKCWEERLTEVFTFICYRLLPRLTDVATKFL